MKKTNRSINTRRFSVFIYDFCATKHTVPVLLAAVLSVYTGIIPYSLYQILAKPRSVVLNPAKN